VENAAGIALSLLPVVGFLVALRLMDGYRLVRLSSVMAMVLAGLGVAVVALPINRGLMDLTGIRTAQYSRYIAPVIEELLKSAYLVYVIRRGRMGFMIDAAICGFAIGTGFALLENIYYLAAQSDVNLFACAMRGFGTAVMHGGATTLFGVVTQSMSERYVVRRAFIFLPGLAAAIAFHSLFNHFLISPVMTAAGLVIVLPLLLLTVFQLSERRVRHWMGTGLDADSDLIAMIKSGRFSQTRIGRYLLSLGESFPPEALVDMLCILRLHAELSIKAKGVLLMREAGLDVVPDPSVQERLDELEYLEKSIGKAGMLAMAPFLGWRTRGLWQLHMLGRRRRPRRRR
jgi:RsiW-degrading membrane proteinase PrsW (M82 family)